MSILNHPQPSVVPPPLQCCILLSWVFRHAYSSHTLAEAGPEPADTGIKFDPSSHASTYFPVSLWFQPRKKSNVLSYLTRLAYTPGESNYLYSHLLPLERSWALMEL